MKILTRLSLAYLAIGLTFQIEAQMPHISYLMPDSLLAEDAFDQLDTSSYLQTGALWDRAIAHFDFSAYQGYNDDATASPGLVLQAYIDLYNSQIDTTNWLSYDSLSTLYQQQMLGFGALPIMTFNYRYETIKANAIQDTLITVIDSQLVINTALGQNPFKENHFWMAGTHIEKVPVNDTFQIVLPGVLYVKNPQGGDSVTSIEINLDDGLGYRQASLNPSGDFEV